MAEATLFDSKVDELLAVRDAALTRLQSAKMPNNGKLDLSAKVTNVDRAFVDADTRVVAVTGLVRRIVVEGDEQLLPRNFIDSVTTALNTVQGRYQMIIDQITNLESQGGVETFAQDTGVFTSTNGQATFKFGAVIQGLWSDCDNALSAMYPLMFAARPKGQPDLTPMFTAVRNLVKQVQAQHEDISKLSKEARAFHQKVSNFVSESEPLRQEITRLASEAGKDRTTILEYASEATQAVTSVRSTNEQAEQLRAAVASYKANFDNFQKQLSQREAALESGMEQQKQLFATVEGIRAQIAELNQQAEAMLSGATVAGLAHSFGALRDKLNTDLEAARKAFYWAIAFLFVSVTPLAIYVIPGLGELLGGVTTTAQTASTPQLIGQIAARALLLLPAAWLTRFAANRHASLFKLKEHYAYKYSVASSVEGFKKQAEPYKDQIAAATFFELTYNPANKLEKVHDDERPPNPILAYVLKRMSGSKD